MSQNDMDASHLRFRTLCDRHILVEVGHVGMGHVGEKSLRTRPNVTGT